MNEHMTPEEAIRWSRRKLWRDIVIACIPLAVVAAAWAAWWLYR